MAPRTLSPKALNRATLARQLLLERHTTRAGEAEREALERFLA